MKFFVQSIALLCAVLMLAACSQEGVRVTASFANTQQFAEGAEVYFDDQVVGEVQEVDPSDSGATLTLRIDPEAAQQMTSNAAVVVNRLKEGAPLEIYNRNSVNAEALQNGQTIKGLDSMVQLGAWMVGDAIQLGAGTLSDYVDSFQDYLSSEKFAQDKATVKKQFDTAREQASTAIDEIGNQIESTVEQLAASEQAAAAAIDELGEELAPIAEELAGDGARLAAELERFAESLEQQAQGEKQAGEAFLASLLTTLEKLNQAMEEGVEQESKSSSDSN